MQKDKQKKAPDKDKTPEPKQQPKKTNKKKPPNVTRSWRRAIPKELKTVAKSIKNILDRDVKRQRAIERAGRVIADMGYFQDRGNHLIIVERAKLIMAFDVPELLSGIQKHADVSKATLVHIPAEEFDNLKMFRTAVSKAMATAKELSPLEVKITNKRRLKKVQKPLDTKLR